MYGCDVNKGRFLLVMANGLVTVVVLNPPGLLYAVGGYDGSNRHCLSSVECYNPETNSWVFVPDMTCKRSGAGSPTHPRSIIITWSIFKCFIFFSFRFQCKNLKQ